MTPYHHGEVAQLDSRARRGAAQCSIANASRAAPLEGRLEDGEHCAVLGMGGVALQIERPEVRHEQRVTAAEQGDLVDW